MLVCERMSRERVSLANLDDDDTAHEMDDHTRVLRYAGAMMRRVPVPPLFVIRLASKLMLIQGTEQTAAADALGIAALDAVVFDALNDAEADEVGALGFDLAERSCDVWAGLQRAYGAPQAA